MMRYHELTETPLADITTHGTPLDQEGSFSELDRRLMKAAILHGIYKEKLKNVPFPLYVYVLNKKGMEQLAKDQLTRENKFNYLMGKVSWKEPISIRGTSKVVDAPFLKFLKPIVMANKAKDPSAVHLILTHNWSEGGGEVPMTSWMIIHRLLHTIYEYDRFELPWNTKIATYPDAEKLNWWDVAMMKSARIGIEGFDNLAELGMEMAVEYVITGKIRINYERIKEKCAKQNLSYDELIPKVEHAINEIKIFTKHQIETFSGSTRYI